MCKCKGIMKLVGGALVLLNAFVWPQWGVVEGGELTGWVAFLGVLMLVSGFLKLVVPACQGCCGSSCETPEKKKKK